jgi:hypothetical protein
MKRPWFSLKPVDDTFFERAPVLLVGRFEVARPAAEVWAELTSDDPLAWCTLIDRIEWTSEPPHGVGSTRTVHALKGLNLFREHFFRWEEGRRKSFYVTESSAPLVRRFAEDYLVESDGAAACVFTWTIAYEPSLLGRIGDPINRRLLGTVFTDTRKHFASG